MPTTGAETCNWGTESSEGFPGRAGSGLAGVEGLALAVLGLGFVVEGDGVLIAAGSGGVGAAAPAWLPNWR